MKPPREIFSVDWSVEFNGLVPSERPPWLWTSEEAEGLRHTERGEHPAETEDEMFHRIALAEVAEEELAHRKAPTWNPLVHWSPQEIDAESQLLQTRWSDEYWVRMLIESVAEEIAEPALP